MIAAAPIAQPSVVPGTIYQRLNIPTKDAAVILDAYFAAFGASSGVMVAYLVGVTIVLAVVVVRRRLRGQAPRG